MRYFAAVAAAACLVESVASTAWIRSTPRSERRNNNSPASQGFVTSKNGQFLVNEKPFFYFGTNAYWLQQLSDDDIDLTFKNIASKNISVVRTWAFNDVVEIPTVGAWFQAFNPNGTVTINTGPNGLQRLDKVFASAKAHGVRVQLALTNNWNPARQLVSNGTLVKRADTNETHPPGFLSNDYGGIDAYVRAHGLDHHDQFFSNQTLIDAFEKYLEVLIPRYKNSTDLVAWELANDARCNSTVPSTTGCNAQTVTKWHSKVGQIVKRLDPNHLVTSGTQGFYCVDCPKLFPLAPRPQPSPAPGQKKRATGPLTAKRLLAQRRASAKRNADTLKQRYAGAAEKRSRGEKGKWMYRGQEARAHTKRQSGTLGTQAVGPAFDGSQGVDSEDIMNIPEMGFSTFQLFPDQNTYGPLDPNLNATANTIQTGIDWIQQQVSSASVFGKPIALTGFGLVTQNNLPAFTPFNASQALFPAPEGSGTNPELPAPTGLGVGIEQNQLPATDEQQVTAYTQWIQAAIANNVAGITQYQWGQSNLTTPPPPPPADGQQQVVPFTPALGQQNVSPNDGYQALTPTVQNVLQEGAQQQLIKNV